LVISKLIKLTLNFNLDQGIFKTKLVIQIKMNNNNRGSLAPIGFELLEVEFQRNPPQHSPIINRLIKIIMLQLTQQLSLPNNILINLTIKEHSHPNSIMNIQIIQNQLQ